MNDKQVIGYFSSRVDMMAGILLSSEGEVDLEAHKAALQALQKQLERINPQPLTLEQLKEIENTPVWLKMLKKKHYIYPDNAKGIWLILYFVSADNVVILNGWTFNLEDYGKTFVLYRYKPESED